MKAWLINGVLVFALAGFSVNGCGTKDLKSLDTAGGRRELIEDIDPFVLGDEFAVIDHTKEADTIDSTAPSDSHSVPSEHAQPDDSGTVEKTETLVERPGRVSSGESLGFRIQIGMFADETDAQKFARTAGSKIDRRIYVIYEAPFFRVRVGDFAELQEAEDYVKHLKSIGYTNSWWIRTKINTP